MKITNLENFTSLFAGQKFTVTGNDKNAIPVQLEFDNWNWFINIKKGNSSWFRFAKYTDENALCYHEGLFSDTPIVNSEIADTLNPIISKLFEVKNEVYFGLTVGKKPNFEKLNECLDKFIVRKVTTCKSCGRELTASKSIDNGRGKTCHNRHLENMQSETAG